MSRGKLKKFAELTTLPNVVQPPTLPPNPWPQPLVVELGCGRGEYCLGLARLYPKQHFVGIDIQGERLWLGAKQALKFELTNVQFLRLQIEQLASYFKPGEITELWLTFPDPFPRDKQAKKRLTSPRFLAIYQTLLRPGGLLHLKTDNQALLEYSIDTINASGGKITNIIRDLYHEPSITPELQIKTTFEQKYLAEGQPIYYLEWHYNPATSSTGTVGIV